MAFDRPGFGHSETSRPQLDRHRASIHSARSALGGLTSIARLSSGIPGGTLVALALSFGPPPRRFRTGARLWILLSHAPQGCVGILAPAIPILGDIISHTVAPFIGEATAPGLIERMFSPQGISPRFAAAFPVPLALRPSQIRAFAEESAHMIAGSRQS